MREVVVTRSKIVLAACGLSFYHAPEMPVPDLQREAQQLPPALGIAGIAVPAVAGLQPRCGTQKLVSKGGIPCWKKLEYLVTDVLVLALPNI